MRSTDKERIKRIKNLNFSIHLPAKKKESNMFIPLNSAAGEKPKISLRLESSSGFGRQEKKDTGAEN
jgi:hypothetical protein